MSKSEFQQLVQDISHETAPSQVAAKTREKQPEPEVDPAADALPEDLVLKDNKRDKPKRPRNKRHGRPR